MSIFTKHARTWESYRFVYPVVSRRSRGLSIGINLNPDKICNFDCVYCSVDRTIPPVETEVDLGVVRDELARLLDLAVSGDIWTHSPFDQTPENLRRLNDIAFSGDGEPTSFAQFGAACSLTVDIVKRSGVQPAPKIIVITNATLFHRPEVATALKFLDQHNGEIWAKLDAGTEEYFQQIERTKVPLQQVLDNILAAGRGRPIVIQSLFLKLAGAAPSDAEIAAYVNRLRDLVAGGCRIKLVQVYTIARPPAEASVTPLESDAIDRIVARVRQLGLSAEGFYGPT
jgi:wyosine [tRNA(Phe)-imidazoG37] synthetase (radical SAM superfamily)